MLNIFCANIFHRWRLHTRGDMVMFKCHVTLIKRISWDWTKTKLLLVIIANWTTNMNIFSSMSNCSKVTSQSIYTYVCLAAPFLASSSGHWRMYHALNTRPIAMHEAWLPLWIRICRSIVHVRWADNERTWAQSIHGRVLTYLSAHAITWNDEAVKSILFPLCLILHTDSCGLNETKCEQGMD